jgi:hypothetical protein
MNIVPIWLWWLFHFGAFSKLAELSKFTQCSPKVCPGGAIFYSVLAANIAYYASLPKTLNMTPPEPMRNAGKLMSDDTNKSRRSAIKKQGSVNG